jgi:hypothetical protein
VSHISKVTDIITFPARTAVGAAGLGIRTTARVLGWAAERVVGQALAGGPSAPVAAAPTTFDPILPDPITPDPGPGPAASDIDPILGSRTTQAKPPARRKVPAGEVPLKSAPTPSLPAALESFDELDDVPEPVPAPATRKASGKKAAATRSPAKKTAGKKAQAKRAPSKQAAVLAPALGLSEDEVAGIASATDQD